jgi:hypothetical protein
MSGIRLSRSHQATSYFCSPKVASESGDAMLFGNPKPRRPATGIIRRFQ